METIASINGAINGVVWGLPMLILLVGAGIVLTCMTAGLQFRKFGYAMKNTGGKIFTKVEAGEGEMPPFQAMSTALASTPGAGRRGLPLLAVGHRPHRHVHQVRGGHAGRQVP